MTVKKFALRWIASALIASLVHGTGPVSATTSESYLDGKYCIVPFTDYAEVELERMRAEYPGDLDELGQALIATGGVTAWIFVGSFARVLSATGTGLVKVLFSTPISLFGEVRGSEQVENLTESPPSHPPFSDAEKLLLDIFLAPASAAIEAAAWVEFRSDNWKRHKLDLANRIADLESVLAGERRRPAEARQLLVTDCETGELAEPTDDEVVALAKEKATRDGKHDDGIPPAVMRNRQACAHCHEATADFRSRGRSNWLGTAPYYGGGLRAGSQGDGKGGAGQGGVEDAARTAGSSSSGTVGDTGNLGTVEGKNEPNCGGPPFFACVRIGD